MTEKKKNEIRELRETGYSYKQIAELLAISENTVKSFCRRNNLGGINGKKNCKRQEQSKCIFCGKNLIRTPGKKAKKFCSDICRYQWWNSHLDQVNRKANYECICMKCGKTFISYGNKNRKYCSHECYTKKRFGGNADADNE